MPGLWWQAVNPGRRRLVGALLITTVYALVVAVQFHFAYSEQRELFEDRSDRVTQSLNGIVADAHRTVDVMRLVAAERLPPQSGHFSDYSPSLTQIDPGRYALVETEEPARLADRVNVTGLGSLEAPGVAEEILGSLTLEDIFRWVRGAYPDAYWVYYLSTQRFITIYPYVSRDQYFFYEALYNKELFTAALPAVNADRRVYTTNVYISEGDETQMVTVAAPVYVDGQFRGVVALDMALRSLNKLINDSGDSGAERYLLDSRGNTLAADADIPTDGRFLARGALSAIDPELAFLADDYLSGVLESPDLPEGYYMSRIEGTPWIYVARRSIASLYLDTFVAILPGIFLLSVVLGAVYIYRRERHTQLQDEVNRRLSEEVQRRTEDLEQQKNAAEQASRAKSDFLSSMSHELRTPLNAIVGFSQLMEIDPALSADHRENVTEIRRAGDHLLELINEVLDLARVEAGRIDLLLKPVPLDTVVANCLSLIESLAAERGIGVTCADLAGVTVLADETRLKQVLLNLLSNAVKYNAPNGTIRIELGGARRGMVRVGVRDTGPGVAPEQLTGLFEPFNRLGADGSEIEGTGIGLPLARNLTEYMGGELEVESEPGEGSVFWVVLPEGHPEDPGLAKAGGSYGAMLSGVAASSDRRRVLYIDDNPAYIKLMGHLCDHRSDVELLTTHDAVLGVDLARSHKPQLILVEADETHNDRGHILDLLRAHEDTRGIPVVAVTDASRARPLEPNRGQGFDDYLTKPIDIRRFNTLLDRFLGGAAGR